MHQPLHWNSQFTQVLKQIKLNLTTTKISQSGTGETQKPSAGLVVQASAMSIAMLTVGISNILPAHQGLFPFLYFLLLIVLSEALVIVFI